MPSVSFHSTSTKSKNGSDKGGMIIMKKIDRAVGIIRGWSDEELKAFLVYRICPDYFKMKACKVCEGYGAGSCVTGWNEESE